ncbi:hypothetical protein QBC35DRAFT_532350 [Podospora australis]|uniref:Uncharacterized protein n=1 Tax=Podospora australis TaxID=1536484 RepID=A0AAN7AIB1_9PEZI|nr:hypothetical protein QBC35DRAFT_532350 [Podospora australis]
MVDFKPRVKNFTNTLEKCQNDLIAWDTTWHYKKCSEDAYRVLWGSTAEADTIYRLRDDIERGANRLSTYVADLFDIPENNISSEWNQRVNHRPRLVRLALERIRFAIDSQQELHDRIEGLKTAISNLKDRGNKRAKVLKGINPDASITPAAALRLQHLSAFADAIWDMRDRPTTVIKTLELRPAGWSDNTNLMDWKTPERISLWVSFDLGHDPAYQRFPPGMRAKLDYTLEQGLCPQNWAESLLGDRSQTDGNADGNPRILGKEPLLRSTKSFRELFMRHDIFRRGRDRIRYKAWQTDHLSHLLPSLVSWSAWLQNSSWMSSLCTSGIRYVTAQGCRPEIVMMVGEIPEPCLHTLSVQRHGSEFSAHGATQRQTQNQYHNLGFALAEIICHTPIRLQPAGRVHSGHYELWNGENWVEFTADEILGAVEKKTQSRRVREAISTSFHDYVEKVYKPVKEWSGVINDSTNLSYLESILPKFTWPNEAFEVEQGASQVAEHSTHSNIDQVEPQVTEQGASEVIMIDNVVSEVADQVDVATVLATASNSASQALKPWDRRAITAIQGQEGLWGREVIRYKY